MYINEGNSNKDPSILVYDGSSIPSVLTTTIYNVRSNKAYLLALKAKNRSGWSAFSPYLSFIAGKLPSPPSKQPALISSSPTTIDFSWQASTDIGGA